ncbi:MAG: hypothetical protein NPIRA05_06590 [Nitrospirales bacterium]|nr:MAG: hypothetical protein NPIRA05_06590 [Nitrospirales bacterium]
MRKPTDQLVGCCWLPRFIDKGRLGISGTLPFFYRIAFCRPMGLDGHFLRHFHLQKKDFLQAVQGSGSTDDGVCQWFLVQPKVTSARIAEWNRYAPRLGEPGYPGYWTFHLLKWMLYPKAVVRPVNSLFDAIIQDET